MARYLTCSRKQREERERALERSRSRGIGKVRTSRNRNQDSNQRNAGSSAIATTTTTRSTDTRRRRNPAREVHRDGNLIGHQLQVVNVYDDRFYVIERLLDKRIDVNGNEEYLVRWQNYPPEYDSWEPRAELEKNALDMILQYNRINQPTDCSPTDLHCICRKPYTFDQGGLIQCLHCKTWYHFSCLKINMVEANSYAKYYCEECRRKFPRLKNVIKRDKVNTLYGNSTLTTELERNDGLVIEQA